MIIHDCVQGTEKWARLRAGRPTSSSFSEIITPSGSPSKSTSAYVNRCIAEVLLGMPLGHVEMPWMTRGKTLEDDAVGYYELVNGVETTPVGFITDDSERIGCSPDRLIGTTGLCEIKCPSDITHTKYLSAHISALLGEDQSVQSVYRVQLQGQLLISEREWVDIISYFPGLPSAQARVYRDEPFIAKLKRELDKFLEMFDQRVAKLKSLGYLFDVSVDHSAPKASGPMPIDKKAKAAPKPKEQPDLGAFGFTNDDLEAYVAKLTAEKKFTQGAK